MLSRDLEKCTFIKMKLFQQQNYICVIIFTIKPLITMSDWYAISSGISVGLHVKEQCK